MTYYKNQPQVTESIKDIDISAQQKKPELVINNIISHIFAHFHGFLIITNIAKAKKEFYCLKIDQKEINLIEKTPEIVNKFSYDINSKNIFLNEQKMNGNITDKLCVKIIRILDDLKQKKAFAFEHN